MTTRHRIGHTSVSLDTGDPDAIQFSRKEAVPRLAFSGIGTDGPIARAPCCFTRPGKGIVPLSIKKEGQSFQT